MSQNAMQNEFLALYIKRWEKLAQRGTGKLLGDLELILERQPEEFEACFMAASDLDGVSVALCAFYNLNRQEHKHLLPKLKQRFVQEVAQELKILESCVMEKGKAYTDFGNLGILWKKLLLIWNEDNKDEIEECLKQIMQTMLNNASKLEDFYSKKYVHAFCEKLLEPMERQYPWVEMYIRTMYIWQKVLEPKMMNQEEGSREDLLSLDKIDGFTIGLLKDYVYALLEEKNFTALAYFLEKTIKVPYENIYGMSEDVFWEKMISTQSKRLMEAWLQLNGRTSLSDLDCWKKMVEEHVTDDIGKRWFTWAYYFFYMELCMDETGMSEVSFFERAQKEMPEVDFPYGESGTFEQIVGAVIYIFGSILDRGWDVLRLIELWGENNPFHFKQKQYYYPSPMRFEYKKKYFDWTSLREKWVDFEIEAGDKVGIYMHSPLRFSMDFRKFVIYIAREYGAECLEELFAPYPIDGRVRNIDLQASARDHIKFEVFRAHVHSDLYWQPGMKKNKAYYNQLFCVEERYYRENESTLQRLEYSTCSFKICGFEEGAENDGKVLVNNIEGGKYKEVDYRMEMESVLAWMENIRTTKTVKDVRKDQFRYVTYPNSVNLRFEFMEAIFDTAFALREQKGEMFHFLGIIHQARLDKMNEYQYQLNQKWVGQPFVPDFHNGFEKRMKKRANDLIYDTYLTKQEKCYLYMNSYLKAYYSLAEFWKRNEITPEDMVSSSSADYDKFLFFVIFEKNTSQGAQFQLYADQRIRVGVKGESYRWLWANQQLPEVVMGKYYRVSIRDIDIDAKTVWIDEVHGEKLQDTWEWYFRRLLDLKDSGSLSYIEKIRKELQEFQVDFYVKNRGLTVLNQYEKFLYFTTTKEYESYNLAWCRGILNVLEQSELFKNREKFLRHFKISSKDWKRIHAHFNEFMEYYAKRLEENSLEFTDIELLDVYYNSPYHIVVSEEKFFEQMYEYYGADEEDLKLRYEKEKHII